MQKQRQDLLEEVRGHYYTERLTLLHCVKHLLGYWQDVSHPYRVSQCLQVYILVLVLNHLVSVSMMWSQEVYRKCLEKIDESELIKGVSHFSHHLLITFKIIDLCPYTVVEAV